jgi:hypothetical protein
MDFTNQKDAPLRLSPFPNLRTSSRRRVWSYLLTSLREEETWRPFEGCDLELYRGGRDAKIPKGDACCRVAGFWRVQLLRESIDMRVVWEAGHRIFMTTRGDEGQTPVASSMVKHLRYMTRQTVTYDLAPILSRAMGFLLLSLYTRFLSPADHGSLEIVMLMTAILNLLVGLAWMGRDQGAVLRATLASAVVRGTGAIVRAFRRTRVLGSAVPDRASDRAFLGSGSWGSTRGDPFGSLYKGSLAIGAPAFDLLEQRNSPAFCCW